MFAFFLPASRPPWPVHDQGGDTRRTAALFEDAVATAAPLEQGIGAVVLSLSLANEGLGWAHHSEIAEVTATFKAGIQKLLVDISAAGALPILGLPYPNDSYTPPQCAALIEVHRQMQGWGFLSVDFLAATEAADAPDGTHRWAQGCAADDGHPKYPFHRPPRAINDPMPYSFYFSPDTGVGDRSMPD